VKSLPQIRNLLEMREISSVILKLSSGEKNEVDDEGEKRIAEATAGRYRKAGKKEKGAILMSC
jgi:hypothetical protein